MALDEHNISEIQWWTLLKNIRTPRVIFTNKFREPAPDSRNKIG